MAKKWKPEGTIKSKLLPIEIATNDYWEPSDDKTSSMVIDGKKRYFTYDEAIKIKTDGWRLPTRAEWMGLCIEFGEKDGDINSSVLGKSLKIKKNGAIISDSLWFAGGLGYYWSSTTDSNTNNAYNLFFNSDGVEPSDSGKQCYGFSVRLVRDIKEER